MQALGGQLLSPAELFLGDLTLGQYMELPDEDRARLWDEWAEEERGSGGEEYNRVLTDHIADLLFTTEPSANENLRREGIPEEKVHFVGNVMIDALVHLLPKAETRPILAELGLAEQRSPSAMLRTGRGAEGQRRVGLGEKDDQAGCQWANLSDQGRSP
jgi:hypothetical protein